MFPYNFIGCILLFSNVYSGSILDSYVVPAIDNQKAPLMAIFDTRSMSLQIAKSLEDPLSKYINDSFDKQVEELVNLKMKEYSMRVEDHVDKLVKSRINALTLKIEEQMKECTHKGLEKKRPAFTVTRYKHPTSITGKVNVKFDRVILNRGNNYDPSTGVFTAPISGLYQFSATIISHGGNHLNMGFYKNQQLVTKLYGATIHGGSATANPVLELSVGDNVYVKHIVNATQNMIGDSYSYFSGYYISE